MKKETLKERSFSEEDRKELKECQLSILKEIDRVCRTNHLSYFVGYGTLLGAIRHNGYIPWDDDVDVLMPGPDFQQLVSLCSSSFSSPFFFQWMSSDGKYSSSMAKARNSQTTYVELSDANKNINHGVFVDLFPIHNWPENPWLRLKIKIWTKISFAKCYVHSYAILKGIDKHPFKENLSNFLVNSLTFYISPRFAAKKLDKLGRRADSLPPSGNCYIGGSARTAIYKTEDFSSQIWHPFENLLVPIPSGFDRVLHDSYGDYMTPPPVEKRVGLHYCAFFDAKVGFSCYLERLPISHLKKSE